MDNGRIYIYRSGILHYRFKLNTNEPITDFQITSDIQQNVAIIAFQNAMESVEYRWLFITDYSKKITY